VLIGGAIHHDSSIAFDRLIKDADALHSLCIPQLEFVLFLEPSPLLEKVEKMRCVSRGEVGLYNISSWSQTELEELLYRRLVQRFPGHFDNDKIYKNFLFERLERIPDNYFETIDAKKQFTKLFLESLSSSDCTPLHALRLARTFISTCAGCWPEDFPLPLTENKLAELAKISRSAL
jgi:hypothetical protein